jgi:hypothetical protein
MVRATGSGELSRARDGKASAAGVTGSSGVSTARATGKGGVGTGDGETLVEPPGGPGGSVAPERISEVSSGRKVLTGDDRDDVTVGSSGTDSATRDTVTSPGGRGAGGSAGGSGAEPRTAAGIPGEGVSANRETGSGAST